MTLLCLVWAFQQVAMKAIGADVSPLLQIALRSGGATLIVAALMWRQGEPVFVRDATTVPGLVAGMLFAIEFVLVGEGLRHTTASHLVVFLYTAPIFAALGLHFTLPSERLHAFQWFGIAVAFAGIALTFMLRSNTDAQPAAGNMLLGDVLALLAGAAWGATTVVIRNSALASASAKRSLLYQLACAAVLPALVTIAMDQTAFRAYAPRLGQPRLSNLGGLRCQLSGVVLAAAALSRFTPWCVLVPHTALRHRLRRWLAG